jgi:hypothetical protein
MKIDRPSLTSKIAVILSAAKNPRISLAEAK